MTSGLRSPGGCAAQHLSLGIAAFMRRLYESIMTWGRAREHHTGCDLGDDAFLDAMRFVDGIFFVARAAWAGLDELQCAPSDEPKPSNHSYPNRCKVNDVHDPILPRGNHVGAGVVRHLKIEKVIGHASFPSSLAPSRRHVLRVRSHSLNLEESCSASSRSRGTQRVASRVSRETRRHLPSIQTQDWSVRFIPYRYRIPMTPKRNSLVKLDVGAAG